MTRRGTKQENWLTRKELASALGCDLRTIAKWQDEGLPVVVKGRGGRPSLFDEAAVRAWKQRRDDAQADPNGPTPAHAARARKELAQAIEAEQRVAIKAKDLVSAKEIELAIANDYTQCKTKLLGLARKAKARLPHLTIADVSVIDKLIREALQDLARG